MVWDKGTHPSRLREVCQDIDHFLDHSLDLNPQEKSQSTESKPASGSISLRGPSLEVQRLFSLNQCLQQEVEEMRRAMRESPCPAAIGQDSQDCRKKRRVSEVEDELAQLRREKDALALDLQETRERCQRELKAVQLSSEEYRRDCQQKESIIARLESQIDARLPPPHPQNEPVRDSRTAELEEEVLALRMLLKEWCPEHGLASQLRSKHLVLEKQLHESQAAEKELALARQKALTLEQENASFRAALEVSELALKDLKGTATECTSARKDLAGHQDVAAEIIQAAQSLFDFEAAEPTPMNLRLAWSQLQSSWAKDTHRNMQLQRQLDGAAEQHKKMQAEVSKLRAEMHCEETQQREAKRKLQESNDAIQNLSAQNSVLRDALAGKGENPPPSSVMESVQQIQTSASEGSSQAVDALKKDVQSLRAEVCRLLDVESKAKKLERVNAELWQANKELEKKTMEKDEPDEVGTVGMGTGDFDSRSTKVLHLLRGPLGQGWQGSRCELSSQLQAGSGDLEQQQAARQLERYKKAMKKYVQEFREGLYHLLGWKVEMRGDGTSLRWHLTSRYQEGQELVFQLRPAQTGLPAEFDLLGTPWAEQLQSDRQAMAYLEVYSSIPGFLAHVTADRLAQQTFTR